MRKAWLVLRRRMRRWLVLIRRYVPPGLRLVLGLLLIGGGILGFLPVLGFWMIPLGVSVAALDVLPIWRWVTGQRTWLGREFRLNNHRNHHDNKPKE